LHLRLPAEASPEPVDTGSETAEAPSDVTSETVAPTPAPDAAVEISPPATLEPQSIETTAQTPPTEVSAEPAVVLANTPVPSPVVPPAPRPNNSGRISPELAALATGGAA